MHYINPNDMYLQRNVRDHHDRCKKYLYQVIQVELNDGSVYQGILHSFDRDKMYILMPKAEHSHHHHMHMDDDNDRQFFPFFGPFGLYGFPFFGIRRFGPFFPFFF